MFIGVNGFNVDIIFGIMNMCIFVVFFIMIVFMSVIGVLC